ncbi:splicing factor 3B subunit 10-domain-containing protein [Cryomyces antarcticus]
MISRRADEANEAGHLLESRWFLIPIRVSVTASPHRLKHRPVKMPHKRYNPASQADTNPPTTTTVTSTSRTTVTPLQNTDQAKDSAAMADKLRTQQQLEALQAKHVGTGHADTTKFEWTSNIHRDTLASIIGHPPLLQYVATGMGLPREIVRKNLLEKMIRPVGPPPEVQD